MAQQKRIRLLFVSLATMLVSTPAVGQAPQEGLSLDVIIELHRNDVPCRPLASHVIEKGINFKVTSETFKRLKAEQICDQVIREIEFARLKKEEELSRIRNLIATGNSYLDKGQYAEAIATFDAARTIQPRNQEILSSLERANRARETEQTMATGQTLSLADLKAMLAKGITSIRVATLIEEQGVNFEFKAEDERNLRAAGANDNTILAVQKKAIEFAKRIKAAPKVTTIPPPASVPGALEVSFASIGSDMIVKQKYNEALELAERALKITNGYHKLWEVHGDALRGLKRLAEAVSSYNKALDISNVEPFIWTKKGLALQGLSRQEEALESFDHALAINPLHYQALIFKGDSLLATKRCSEAKNTYDKSLEINPAVQLTLVERYEMLKKKCAQ